MVHDPGRPRTAPVLLAAACDIVVRTPFVSRGHAELLVEEDQVVLRDLGSSHGRWINDDPVVGPTAVLPGDTTRCGRQESV